MILGSPYSVPGAGIARGHADGDAEERRILESAVQRCHRLLRPGGFGTAPADADDARLVD